LFILIAACVDPLKIKLLPETNKLVVDGLITNEAGPYEVSRSYSLGFDNTTLKKPTMVTGASVWIMDDLGNSEKLTEESSGIYKTSINGIQGTVGRAYSLKIKTASGHEYQSDPQRLTPSGEINDVSFEFVSQGLKGNKPGQYIDALRILVDAHGAEGERNLMRWRWTYVYRARTFPEFKTTSQVFQASNGQFFWSVTPIPEACSGYVRDPNVPPLFNSQYPPQGFGTKKVAECTCCECWPFGYNTLPFISHNRVFDGLEFRDVDLGLIPATSMPFYDKYYLNVEQLSLSDEEYAFWDLVDKQNSAQGNIFQPNSVKIHSNVKSLTDPEEEVLGLFGVSGITRKEMYIPKEVVPYKLHDIDTITHACNDSFQNVYKVKPSFW
jgi:hypothetical protein